MKLIKQNIAVIVALFLFTINANAQNDIDGDRTLSPNTLHKMNHIKINLTALALKNYSFQYERILNKKFAVALGFRTMPNGLLPLQSILKQYIGNDTTAATEQIKNVNLGNTAITIEARFYTGKKGYGRGFYLAPYYKNTSFSGSGITYNYSTNSTAKNISLSGNLKSNTFGLLFGAQFNLGKYISLDWWILGPEYGTVKGSFSGIATAPLSSSEQTNLKNDLQNLDIPFIKNKIVNVNANGASAQFDGPFVGLRTGLAIGVRF